MYLDQRFSTGGLILGAMAPQEGLEAFTGGPGATPELDSQARFSIAINLTVTRA